MQWVVVPTIAGFHHALQLRKFGGECFRRTLVRLGKDPAIVVHLLMIVIEASRMSSLRTMNQDRTGKLLLIA